MEQICDKNKCTGCGACQNICKRNAIKMDFNKEGFIIPIFDPSKCVDCQQCIRVCPVNHPRELNEPITAYKGSSNNVEIKKQSSSGGIFSELAKVVLSEGGSVFGAYLDDTLSVRHIMIEDEQDLGKIRGSKYIGSDTSNVFRLIQAKLNEGETVLFSGTPCQVAGLKNYVNNSIGTLITTDFICHGVGSKTLFTMYIEHEEKKINSKVETFVFRSKIKNYTDFPCLFTFNNAKTKTYNFYKTSFGNAFSTGKINRISCSTCQYANKGRVSDITLADCIHNLNMTEKKLGCSFVIISTELGKSLIDKSDISINPINIEEISKVQSHLSKPQSPHEYRSLIFQNIDEGYEYIVNKYMAPPKKSIIKSLKERFRYAKSKFYKS
ncbi:F420H2:quinone oxidoreductase [Ruminococcus albus SY3]|uniref:F420H2:quinone oxidoreductase n=1 Tax=Ruminococcus albus SY3 TaxID=1341156 RepID=A0A011V590_RUMAL|nr:Coenzyme F420 hydrogenase/dehydrogenase, beta subunit C-terminal domain [Ruminococcus albus]EXM40672.1 F420H2:quinone oxidoreductase [Ruminococcus albus SY3]